MNKRRSKTKATWLESEEGRITTLVRQGLLSIELGKRMLLELQRAAELKIASQSDSGIMPRLSLQMRQARITAWAIPIEKPEPF